MASRASLLARMRRLERPSSSVSALVHELMQLRRRHPTPHLADLPHMSREQLDDLFRAESAEDGPAQRMLALEERLRQAGWSDPHETRHSPAELDALFAMEAP